MKKLVAHIKRYIFRGLLAVVPLFLTYLAIKLLYTAIDQRAVGLADRFLGFRFPGLGILLVLVSLYILGLLASNVAGKKLFGLLGRITNHIPLIKTTYKVGQQLGATLSLPEKQIFKKAVLVQYLKPGIGTLGFVTGEVTERKQNDEKLLKVFVSTPHPTPLREPWSSSGSPRQGIPDGRWKRRLTVSCPAASLVLRSLDEP